MATELYEEALTEIDNSKLMVKLSKFSSVKLNKMWYINFLTNSNLGSDALKLCLVIKGNFILE